METALKRAAVTENLLLIDGVGFYNFHNNNKSFVLFCVYPTGKIPRLFKISAYSLYCPTCPQLEQILAVKYSFIQRLVFVAEHQGYLIDGVGRRLDYLYFPVDACSVQSYMA
jgi:hypothetical protein